MNVTDINSIRKVPRAIAISSGKGGVGKTSLAINLSIALADRGQRVTLFDADYGLANVDVLLNLRPLRNLQHVLSGEAELKDVMINGPGGIRIIPAASGVEMMANLGVRENQAMIRGFDQMARLTDTLIIDTAAGISNSVIQLCSASQEVVVVVCNEPASTADAYALIKVLNQDYQIDRFRILVNKVNNQTEGLELYRRLVAVSNKYLDASLHLMGIVPYDKCFNQAAQKQRALLSQFPSSPGGLAFKKLASEADKWPRPENSSGKMMFFVDQFLQSRPHKLRRVGP